MRQAGPVAADDPGQARAHETDVPVGPDPGGPFEQAHHRVREQCGRVERVLAEVDIERSGLLLESPADTSGQKGRDRAEVRHADSRGRDAGFRSRLGNIVLPARGEHLEPVNRELADVPGVRVQDANRIAATPVQNSRARGVGIHEDRLKTCLPEELAHEPSADIAGPELNGKVAFFHGFERYPGSDIGRIGPMGLIGLTRTTGRRRRHCITGDANREVENACRNLVTLR